MRKRLPPCVHALGGIGGSSHTGRCAVVDYDFDLAVLAMVKAAAPPTQVARVAEVVVVVTA